MGPGHERLLAYANPHLTPQHERVLVPVRVGLDVGREVEVVVRMVRGAGVIGTGGGLPPRTTAELFIAVSMDRESRLSTGTL